jgi:hypothetical protein
MDVGMKLLKSKMNAAGVKPDGSSFVAPLLGLQSCRPC